MSSTRVDSEGTRQEESEAYHGLDSWEDAEDIPVLNQSLKTLSLSNRAPDDQKIRSTPSLKEKAGTQRGNPHTAALSSTTHRTVSLTPAEIKQNPVLSGHGVNLGDMRQFVDLPADDVISHGLYLSGFTPGVVLPPNEEQMLVAPWTDAGAIIR